MRFDEILRRWNGGISRGAQVRLAKKLGLTEGVISRWAKGDLMPGEELRPRLAKELGVTADELMESLGRGEGVQRVKEPPGAYVAEQSFSSLILGRLDQLTKQVADLQERCGVLDYQLKHVQAEVRSTREPVADKTPHESGGTRKKN